MAIPKLIGKTAKIVCLTEQLRSFNVKNLNPGDVVEIIEDYGDHIIWGSIYKIESIEKSVGYIIPLRWLEIKN